MKNNQFKKDLSVYQMALVYEVILLPINKDGILAHKEVNGMKWRSAQHLKTSKVLCQ